MPSFSIRVGLKGSALAFGVVPESADEAGIHRADIAAEAQVAVAALQASAQGTRGFGVGRSSAYKDFTALVDAAKKQLAEGDVDALVNETLFSLYAALPSTWRVKDETDAKRYFQLFMKMLGADVRAEQTYARGYADAIVETKKAVYVFEFKFNKSAKAAIRQIREKGYADAYKGGKRPVTLFGINFSAKKRNIDEPLLESL